jgi:hypothetical protein
MTTRFRVYIRRDCSIATRMSCAIDLRAAGASWAQMIRDIPRSSPRIRSSRTFSRTTTSPGSSPGLRSRRYFRMPSNSATCRHSNQAKSVMPSRRPWRLRTLYWRSGSGSAFRQKMCRALDSPTLPARPSPRRIVSRARRAPCHRAKSLSRRSRPAFVNSALSQRRVDCAQAGFTVQDQARFHHGTILADDQQAVPLDDVGLINGADVVQNIRLTASRSTVESGHVNNAHVPSPLIMTVGRGARAMAQRDITRHGRDHRSGEDHVLLRRSQRIVELTERVCAVPEPTQYALAYGCSEFCVGDPPVERLGTREVAVLASGDGLQSVIHGLDRAGPGNKLLDPCGHLWTVDRESHLTANCHASWVTTHVACGFP